VANLPAEIASQEGPQLSVGPPLVAAVASIGLTVDAHLMVDEPIRILPEIVAAGAAVVTVHAESTRYLYRTLQELAALADRQDRQILRGVGISPGTPVQTLEPVLELADKLGCSARVGVDGGVTLTNADEVRRTHVCQQQ
jgi:pentose-5-phosphate-3-epimerase